MTDSLAALPAINRSSCWPVKGSLAQPLQGLLSHLGLSSRYRRRARFGKVYAPRGFPGHKTLEAAVFITDQDDPDIAYLEARHRGHSLWQGHRDAEPAVSRLRRVSGRKQQVGAQTAVRLAGGFHARVLFRGQLRGILACLGPLNP
jgi:hypothetical protein